MLLGMNKTKSGFCQRTSTVKLIDTGGTPLRSLGLILIHLMPNNSCKKYPKYTSKI
jgi:hypothetical protein